jgi:hypothetical protein
LWKENRENKFGGRKIREYIVEEGKVGEKQCWGTERE